jgi:hypothetical protein
MEPENEPIGPPQQAHVQIRRFGWETDGINGGPSSMRILLDWLSSQDNWERWAGVGATKRILAEEILQVMRSHGINHRHRVGELVISLFGSGRTDRFFELIPRLFCS